MLVALAALLTNEAKQLIRATKAGALYFVLVFGAGFLLGPIRIMLLVPRVGSRTAELLEVPLMFAVIVFSARFVIRRLTIDSTTSSRVAMGLLAFLLLLVAELTLVLWLRDMSVGEYFATRDPVAGIAYYSMLVVFAAMPLLLSRK